MPGQPTFVNPTRDPLLPAGIGIGLDRGQPLEVEFTFVTGGGGGVQDLAAPTQWLTSLVQMQQPSRAMSTFGDQVAIADVFSDRVGGVFDETQIRIFNADGSSVRTVRPAGVFTAPFGMAFIDADTIIGVSRGRASYLSLSTGVVRRGSNLLLNRILFIPGSGRAFDGDGDFVYHAGAANADRDKVFRYEISSDTSAEFITGLDGNITDLSATSDRIALRTDASPNMVQFFDAATGEERSENNVLFEQVSGVDFSDFAISATSIYYRQTPNVAVPGASFRFTASWWSQLRPTGEFTAWAFRRSVNAGASWLYWNGSTWVGSLVELPLADLTMTGCVVARVGATCWRTSINPWTSGSSTHLFQVLTKDTRRSIWSDSLTVLPDTQPPLTIDSPTAPDISESYAPRWTTQRQAYYRVTAYSGTTLLQSSGVITSSANSHAWGSSGLDQELGQLPMQVDDGDEIRVEVDIWTTRFLRVTATVTGAVRYLPPPLSTLPVVNAVREQAYIAVQWGLVASTGGRPDTATVELWRRVEDLIGNPVEDEVLVLRDETPSSFSFFIDHYCPFNTPLGYRVVTLGSRDQHDARAPWVR